MPDIKDFTLGIKAALKEGGTVTLEFPHLMRLIESLQFDTIYHEHFSYLSLHTVILIFKQAGLRIFDVEELKTHGGSLRVFGCHQDDSRAETDAIKRIISNEKLNRLHSLEPYQKFQSKVDYAKYALLTFLIEQKKQGKCAVAYGAAAKGNTLLNYAGIKPDLLTKVCDAAPAKQNKFMPGSHIPIVEPAMLREMKPDVVLILPWNISAEVAEQHSYIKDWGGRFFVAIPKVKFLECN